MPDGGFPSMRRAKTIVLIAVLIDVLGFGMVIPILPFYVTEFGAEPTTVTALFMSFSLFSFFSAPLLGALSDRVGRRPVMILSIVSTAVGWFVFAGAQSLWQLFLGRIIDGAAAGNFTTAQSYLVDLSRDEEERTHNLGLVGAVFGIGFVLGPLLGGLLSQVSHAFPFWIAGALAMANAIGAVFILPETHHRRETSHRLELNPLVPILRGFRDARLRPVLTTWFLFAVAFVAGQSVFALFTRDVFAFSAFATGMSFTLVGVVVVINQGVFLKRVWLKRFDLQALERIMLAVLAVSLGLMATASFPLFVIALLGMGTGQAVLRVTVTSQAAGLAGSGRKGEVMGVISGLMSLAMVISPLVAGALFEVNPSIPFILASLLLALGLGISLRRSSAPLSS
jgi:multidrug resistance protein